MIVTTLQKEVAELKQEKKDPPKPSMSQTRLAENECPLNPHQSEGQGMEDQGLTMSLDAKPGLQGSSGSNSGIQQGKEDSQLRIPKQPADQSGIRKELSVAQSEVISPSQQGHPSQQTAFEMPHDQEQAMDDQVKSKYFMPAKSAAI